MAKGSPNIIGRIDKADFPKINLKRIKVKIDTGAYTSSFHCCRIEETKERKLRVVFLDPDDPKYTGKAYLFKRYSKKSVKSSNGESEERFIISTKIRFHRRIYRAEFSLTYRREMRYPVLIGRKFLAEHNFVVNPRLRNYLHQKRKTKKLSAENEIKPTPSD
ncbi:MAG: RimK/LysX family protein [Pyrinomonadaceae bacterium]